jgi:hypothetical protein
MDLATTLPRNVINSDLNVSRFAYREPTRRCNPKEWSKVLVSPTLKSGDFNE